MRRCLHAFFTGLLTLSLVTAPAHACWRSRPARHCRAVHVVPAWQTPAWEACCEPCGMAVRVEVVEASAVSDCCPALPVAADCCGEAVVVESHVVADEVSGWADEGVVSIVESHSAPATESAAAARAEPTMADAATASPNLESIAAPPALEPAGGVTPASNEQPVADTPAAPAAESVLAAPEMREDVEPQGQVPAEEPAEPAPAASEPPMEVEPEVATEAAEPAPAAEEKPALPVEPAPEEPNIFEELDARDAPAPAAGEEEMAEESAADPFGGDAPEFSDSAPPAPASEPVTTADEAQEESEDSVAGEPDGADGEMAADEPADPFAVDDAAETEEPAAPAEDSDPAAADPLAATELPRRWIDATGAGSIVATLVSVAGHDHCVLETRGRRVVVPLENLSRHDRDYVRRADARLATHGGQAPKGKAAVPAPAARDTAGL